MTLAVAQKSIASTAVQKLVAVTGGAVPVDVGAATDVLVQNTHASQHVYVGGADVTTSTGYRVAAATTSQPLPLDSGEELYAIADTTATIVVHVYRGRRSHC